VCRSFIYPYQKKPVGINLVSLAFNSHGIIKRLSWEKNRINQIMHKHFNHLFTLLVALSFFSGCGTKGPLYETPPTPVQKQQIEEIDAEPISKKD